MSISTDSAGTDETLTPRVWTLVEGDSPIVAAAIHDGHALRPEIEALVALSDEERLREEDPFTAGWTVVTDNRVIGGRSRFEVDLNRPRDQAIYLRPEDAWGLTVYRETRPAAVLERTLAQYDAFYAEMLRFFTQMARRHGKFVVLDLHSYNHRRGGPGEPAAEPKSNPEVNIGTGTMPNRDRWAGLIDRFIRDLAAFDYDGGHLDVRENVKFQGGNFPRWIHATFPENACVLSVEFKKFFMNEWSGQAHENQLNLIQRALASTIPRIRDNLGSVQSDSQPYATSIPA